MSLVCTHASFATVEELFQYKHEGFELPPFASYTPDEWGIKAHNRPWIAAVGEWEAGQRVIELGGAYSRLAEYLGEQHGVEPWVGDDFGEADGDDLWSRWGNPRDLPEKYPKMTYRFENFGPGSGYESDYFDRLFSVSTLEHIPPDQRLGVLRDMHRTVAPGGMELHTVDVQTTSVKRMLFAAAVERTPLRSALAARYVNGVAAWWGLFAASGVRMQAKMPSTLGLMEPGTLVESPALTYRYIPPNNAPKSYRPAASLKLIIRDQ